MGRLVFFQGALRALVIGLLSWALLLPAAQAHLMVAQRGTLNLVDDGAFLVLSLPVSAFQGVDDDGDGLLSGIEFAAHRQTIVAEVNRGVVLSDEQGPRELQGMMLSLAPPEHEIEVGASSQLVVMGRFGLANASVPLRFQVNLFGKTASEQQFRINASRAAKSEQHLMVLTPQESAGALFPSAWQTFADYVWLGATHIFEGLDHLLFLAVVLAAGWGLRYVLVALTLFTAGHAVTLVLSLKGWVSFPVSVVEPAIAATIVGMAAFDAVARYRGRRPPRGVLYGLVFACSLIHGLGLGAALSELGLDKLHQLPSLAGFNLGIELAQVSVALAMLLLALVVHGWRGGVVLQRVTRWFGAAAMGVGVLWFAQRLSGWA